MYNKYGRKRAVLDAIPAMLLVAAVLFCVVVATMNYMDVASTCNGVVVRDYMGQPVCVSNPTISIHR